ncbi:MAG: ATP phosphoribosyltransferase [Candidatus Izimaplasma sp.]|nr:ATP phosphoribosyltransferase [Candidatus Izimaplasma bacterium]
MDNYLYIALPKGRLADETIEIFNKIIPNSSVQFNSRKLQVKDEVNEIIYLLVKPSDVLTYVNSGSCDLGIVGKDTIDEERKEIYELVDLNIGKCKLAIAGLPSFNLKQNKMIKIATKYPNITQKYFEKSNKKTEIFKLNGSVELAPIIGLSDVIVDIVETGKTLKENGLEVLEDMHQLSARLVSNKSSYRLKYNRINTLIDLLEQEVKNND